jgi:hypothetical protein
MIAREVGLGFSEHKKGPRCPLKVHLDPKLLRERKTLTHWQVWRLVAFFELGTGFDFALGLHKNLLGMSCNLLKSKCSGLVEFFELGTGFDFALGLHDELLKSRYKVGRRKRCGLSRPFRTWHRL